MPSDVIRQGSIVFADDVPDEHNRNPKTRPIVVITPDEELLGANTFFAVAVTTQISSVPTAQAVILRHNPNGHSRTGLKVKSAAACHWIVEMRRSNLQNVVGHCNRLELDAILAIVFDADNAN